MIPVGESPMHVAGFLGSTSLVQLTGDSNHESLTGFLFRGWSPYLESPTLSEFLKKHVSFVGV